MKTTISQQGEDNEEISDKQAFEELFLNLKHQKIKPICQAGYEFDKGRFVFALIIPNLFKKK